MLGAYLDRKQPSGGRVIVAPGWEEMAAAKVPFGHWEVPLEPPVPYTFPAGVKLDVKLWLDRLPSFQAEHKSLGCRVLANTFRRSVEGNAKFAFVTHSTIESVHKVAITAAAAQSRISVAVVAKKSISFSFEFVKRLRECSADVHKHVDFHFVFLDGQDAYNDFKLQDPARKSFVDLVKGTTGSFDAYSCDEVLHQGFSMIEPFHPAIVIQSTPPPDSLLVHIAVQQAHADVTLALPVGSAPSKDMGQAVQRVFDAAESDAQLALIVLGLIAR